MLNVEYVDNQTSAELIVHNVIALTSKFFIPAKVIDYKIFVKFS